MKLQQSILLSGYTNTHNTDVQPVKVEYMPKLIFMYIMQVPRMYSHA